MSIEANWNRMTLQTGWKLQPCFVPLQSEDDDSSLATGNEAGKNAIAATHTSDSANGSPDSADSEDV